MSDTKIYEGFGNGYAIYTSNGQYVNEGCGVSGTPLATIEGDKIFLNVGGSGIEHATVRGNQVFAGFGGGTPMFTIRGNQVFDGHGSGTVLMTSDQEDLMALAAAACLRFGDESLRTDSTRRINKSVYDEYKAKQTDGNFASHSNCDELMGMAGFAAPTEDPTCDFGAAITEDAYVPSGESKTVRKPVDMPLEIYRYYRKASEKLVGYAAPKHPSVVRENFDTKWWADEDWQVFYRMASEFEFCDANLTSLMHARSGDRMEASAAARRQELSELKKPRKIVVLEEDFFASAMWFAFWGVAILFFRDTLPVSFMITVVSMCVMMVGYKINGMANQLADRLNPNVDFRKIGYYERRQPRFSLFIMSSIIALIAFVIKDMVLLFGMLTLAFLSLKGVWYYLVPEKS